MMGFRTTQAAVYGYDHQLLLLLILLYIKHNRCHHPCIVLQPEANVPQPICRRPPRAKKKRRAFQAETCYYTLEVPRRTSTSTRKHSPTPHHARTMYTTESSDTGAGARAQRRGTGADTPGVLPCQILFLTEKKSRPNTLMKREGVPPALLYAVDR